MATLKQEMEFFHEVRLLCPLPTLVAWTSCDAKEIYIRALLPEHETKVLTEIKMQAVVRDDLLHEWRITEGNSVEAIVFWRDIHSVVDHISSRLAECWVNIIQTENVVCLINEAHYILQVRFRALKSKLIAGIVQGTLQQYEKRYVEPWLADMNRKFYSDAGKGTLSEEVIRMSAVDQYLRRDLLSYPWARSLVQCAVSEVTNLIRMRDDRWFEKINLTAPEDLASFIEYYLKLKQALFSTRAMRRSLSRMPGHLPHQTIENLLKLQQAGLKFESPLPNDRVVWLVVSVLAQVMDERTASPIAGSDSPAEHLGFVQAVYDVIRRTPINRLRQLMRRECPSGLRKSHEIMMVMRNLLDIPKDTVIHPRTQLSGLIELSKHIHRQEYIRSMKFDPGTPTVQPPIPLPNDKRLTFLNTCQALYDEGAAMHHCVGWGHAENAVQSYAYYFHFEDSSGKATVMVSSTTGKVAQAFGPHNKITTTSRRASRLLAAWGKNLNGLPIPILPPPANQRYAEIAACALEEFPL
jgi:PcfJ-like protein